MIDRLRMVLETFGAQEPVIARGEWLRDEMNQTFVGDVTDDFVAGLMGETEPMTKYGLTVTPRDIPVDTESVKIRARLQAYGSQFWENSGKPTP